MNAAALTLVITSVAAFWLQLAGFVAVSRALEELQYGGTEGGGCG